MRATRAYITSFGTTGLLVSSALLMLSVMSAFVAFNGFPGQDVQDPIGTLLLQEPQATVTVPAQPAHVRVLGSRRTAATAHHRTAARRADAPIARTAPVHDRTSPSVPGETQAPSSTPQPSSTAAPSGSVTPELPSGGGDPSLPDTNLPPAPSLTVPPVTPPPPEDAGLPIDTSGITGILGH